jgi:protein TonB
MAYLQQTSSNQKAVTMGAVAAIHAIAIYAVVSGLAVDIITHPPTILETWNKPVEKKPDPPKEIPKDQATSSDTALPVNRDWPGPRIDEFPLPQIPLGPTGGEMDAGGGGTELPLPPVAEPKSLFTAKAPKPRGNQANWVRQEDYPTRAIQLELEGLTRVKLEVSASGRVTDCTVTASSGHELLDNAACAKLADRARFNPATDTSGQVSEGTFTTSVRWQLPE